VSNSPAESAVVDFEELCEQVSAAEFRRGRNHGAILLSIALPNRGRSVDSPSSGRCQGIEELRPDRYLGGEPYQSLIRESGEPRRCPSATGRRDRSHAELHI